MTPHSRSALYFWTGVDNSSVLFGNWVPINRQVSAGDVARRRPNPSVTVSAATAAAVSTGLARPMSPTALPPGNRCVGTLIRGSHSPGAQLAGEDVDDPAAGQSDYRCLPSLTPYDRQHRLPGYEDVQCLSRLGQGGNRYLKDRRINPAIEKRTLD